MNNKRKFVRNENKMEPEEYDNFLQKMTNDIRGMNERYFSASLMKIRCRSPFWMREKKKHISTLKSNRIFNILILDCSGQTKDILSRHPVIVQHGNDSNHHWMC